jgi:hypothetical protein
LPKKWHQIGPPCCIVSSWSPIPGAPTARGWDLDRSARGLPKLL